jgi:hypothetical protein
MPRRLQSRSRSAHDSVDCAEPVGQRDQLLLPVGTDPDHHQQAHLVLLQPDLEVDPVDPAVDVVGVGQRPLAERLGVVLPLAGEPGDRRRRQARGRAEELLQRRAEVTAGQAVQIQQRQHLGDLRGLPGPGRQDHRSEPHPLAAVFVDALVVDPRRPHQHRTRRRAHLPLRVVPVADHQPATRLVDLVGVGVYVRSDLSLQRRRQHRPRAVTGKLVKQRPADSCRGVCVGLVLLVDYLEHGRTFPNQRSNAGPDQNHQTSRSSSGRCAPSRHPAEGHPQVLIIAPIPPLSASVP